MALGRTRWRSPSRCSTAVRAAGAARGAPPRADPPAAQHPEIFTVTTSALGPLYDPYIDNALKRSDGVHDIAFAVLLKAQDSSKGRYVGMTRYLNIEEAHKKLEIGSTWYEPSTWGGRSIRSASCS